MRQISDSDVPIGIDPAGNPVGPFDAKKGIAYKCPSCNEGLVLRKGQIRIHHFSHRKDSQCSPESRLHKAAKAVITKVVRDLMSGTGQRPEIHLKHSLCLETSTVRLLADATGVEEEYRLPSGRVLDIAILKGDKVKLGVEIYVTHRVDELKKVALDCPWIELDALDVTYVPLHWDCLAQGRVFQPCSVCERMSREHDEKERIAAQTAAKVAARPTLPLTPEKSEALPKLDGEERPKVQPYPTLHQLPSRGPAMKILLDGGPLCVANAWDWVSDHSRPDLFRIYHKKTGATIGPFYTSITLAETGMKKAIKLGKHLWEVDVSGQKWLHKWVDEQLGKAEDLVGGHWAPDPEGEKAS